MKKEIGSTFWIKPDLMIERFCGNDLEQRFSDFDDAAFFSSGRSAQAFVLKDIEEKDPQLKKVAVIPAYTCTTVVKPFLNAGYVIKTYDIDLSLHADVSQIASIILDNNASVVLFHRYFGFDTCNDWNQFMIKFQNLGVIFIEDKTQCLLSDLPVLSSDYIIASIRKWGEIPDGGIALSRKKLFKSKPEIWDSEMVKLRVEASCLKYKYMILDQGDKRVFRQMFEQAASLLENENCFYNMSPIAKNIMLNIDWEQVKLRRQKNYQLLYENLKLIKDIKIISGEPHRCAVPLYLSILVENRSSLQQFLRDKNIYLPIIWPYDRQGFAISDTVRLIYNNNLCIPIDQRYDEDDMQRVLICINKFFGY